MDPKKNYYAVLGVPENAGEDEIRKAFRRLAKKHHPDVNPGDKNAENRFKEANEAHEVLSDRKKREEYDALRSGMFAGGFRSGGGPFGRGGRPGFGRAEDPGVFFGSGGVSFEDVLGDFLRKGGAGGRTAPGGDVEIELYVDFLDMARGAEREVRYLRPRACPSCGGTGRSGRKACAACRGSGSQEVQEQVKVKVPAGAQDGSRIRVAGRGEETSGGSGDLVITMRMIPHRYFRREGSDIFLDLPIHYSEAVRGAKIQVPTIDGPVTLTVPAGSSSGRKLRLKGKGVPAPGRSGRGDQYVVLHVAVPQEASTELLKLVERLAEFEAPNLRSGWN